MVDFEVACRSIDDLVDQYKLIGNHRPALRESTTKRMFDYVNGLGGEAGLHKHKLIKDYLRRVSLIEKLEIYSSSVPQADGDDRQ